MLSPWVWDDGEHPQAVLNRLRGHSAEAWTCVCNYMNTGPICTHCGRFDEVEAQSA